MEIFPQCKPFVCSSIFNLRFLSKLLKNVGNVCNQLFMNKDNPVSNY